MNPQSVLKFLKLDWAPLASNPLTVKSFGFIRSWLSPSHLVLFCHCEKKYSIILKTQKPVVSQSKEKVRYEEILGCSQSWKKKGSIKSVFLSTKENVMGSQESCWGMIVICVGSFSSFYDWLTTFLMFQHEYEHVKHGLEENPFHNIISFTFCK